MSPTSATSYRLKRTLSQETLATTISDLSTPSLIYPSAPLNTPTTQSVAGAGDTDHDHDHGHNLMITATGIKTVTDLLQRSASHSPSTFEADQLSSEGDIDIYADLADDGEDAFKGGKAHLRAFVREDAALGQQLFKSPERLQRKRALGPQKHDLLKWYASAQTDRSVTPTRLSFLSAVTVVDTATGTGTSTTTATPGLLEYNNWSPVAEEDTERALKRMAMLARDEHQKDPKHSVEEYYSMRLAKLIEEAEIAFDATHLH